MMDGSKKILTIIFVSKSPERPGPVLCAFSLCLKAIVDCSLQGPAQCSSLHHDHHHQQHHHFINQHHHGLFPPVVAPSSCCGNSERSHGFSEFDVSALTSPPCGVGFGDGELWEVLRYNFLRKRTWHAPPPLDIHAAACSVPSHSVPPAA